jgi:hypothetical protein
MTDRERWIVYPLLFLAVGLGLKSGAAAKLTVAETDVVDAETVRCKKLLVVTPGPDAASVQPVAIIGADTHGRGVVETFSADGRPQARLSSDPVGAILTLFDRQAHVAMVTGINGRGVGISVGRYEQDRFTPIITLPLVPAHTRELPPAESKADGTTGDEVGEPGAEKSLPGTDNAQPRQPAADTKPDDASKPDK